jgi:1,4-alpha-glucan branching enzyme
MTTPPRDPDELGDVDLYLFSEGRHESLWKVLGAIQVSDGVRFSVWAPNALRVEVAGDFNGWDHSRSPLSKDHGSGVWVGVEVGAVEGQHYKFAIQDKLGQWSLRADPMARAAEAPPSNASVITGSHHEWSDQNWIAARHDRDHSRSPMSIYEVHLGSWQPGLGYRDAALVLADYAVEHGFTHVELLPVAEHPYGPSWGYQVTSYFAPTARLGTPDDFRFFVDHLHSKNIGVLLDWVPAHFPRDDWALARFDGTPLYEHPAPHRGEHPDWGTLVFNFGRPQVRNFLVSNAVYWCEEFHIDGLRVDAVASMLYLDYSRQAGEWHPNVYGGNENLEAVQFMQELNATVYRRAPGVITVAEESTSWPGVTARTDQGGLGFGFKWNMGWMSDSLRYLAREPIHRQHHHDDMTFALTYAWTENFILALSHDEVVHGKRSLASKVPGDTWQKLATLRAFLASMWAHPGKKLIFMGAEFGQLTEWSDERGPDWFVLDQELHQGVRRCVGDINRTYRAHSALWEQDATPSGFTWIDVNDAAHNVYSWVRWSESGESVVCVSNFSPSVWTNHRLGLPHAGRWNEVINTDAAVYGGSGKGNLGSVVADAAPYQGQPASAWVTLPPLATLWFTADRS